MHGRQAVALAAIGPGACAHRCHTRRRCPARPAVNFRFAVTSYHCQEGRRTMPPDKTIGTEGDAEEAEIAAAPVPNFNPSNLRMYTGASGISSRPLPARCSTSAPERAGMRPVLWQRRAVSSLLSRARRRASRPWSCIPCRLCVDDGSPELAQIARRRKAFDLVMLRPFGCISMQARRVMPVASAPVAPGETMVPTQRRGPLPAQRADIRRDAPKKRSASPTPRRCSRSSG